MQADVNNAGRGGAGAHSDPASSCLEISTKGTSVRYRFRSPITRHARSLGAEEEGWKLAGIRMLQFFRERLSIQRDPAPRAAKLLYSTVKR